MQNDAFAVSGGQGGSQGAHLWDYWAVVMKRLWVVLLFLAAALGAAWVVTRSQEPQYRATAILELAPRSAGAGDMFAPAILGDERYLETQLAKLRLPTMIHNAVRNKRLAALKDFDGKSENEIVRMAAGRIEVALQRGKLLVDVSVTGPDPRGLDDIANALVSEFQEQQRSETRARKESKRSDLEERIRSLRKNQNLWQVDKNGILEARNFDEATFESRYNLLYERQKGYAEERDRVQREIFRDRPSYEAIQRARQDAENPVESLAQLPQVRLQQDVQNIGNRMEEAREERARRLRVYDLLHPKIAEIDAEIERLAAEWRRSIEGYVNVFLLEYQGRVERLMDLDRELEVLGSELKQLVKIRRDVDEKNEAIERTREEIRDLQTELEPINAAILAERDSVHVIQTAAEPTTPFAPNPRTNIILGAVLGCLGGISLAFLLDYLDDTIRTKEELAKIAPNVPLLGIVPNIQGRSGDPSQRDLFAHAQPKSTISEAYRGVRTSLTLSAHGPMQKSLLLTSAGPREGKTTTAINLATVLAYSGGRTLIVDADLRKPRIHKSFGLPNTRGLTNLIIGSDDPASLCQRTAIDRVDLLPSGPIPPNPSELLGHPRMREVLRLLLEKYDHVIVDTPPIGAVTDAAVLATIVDGVILVVHAGKTRRQIVSRGLEQLRHINARVVGVILNNLRVGRIRYYPGYYQYYYYASHYGAEETPPDRTPKRKSPRPEDTGAPPDA